MVPATIEGVAIRSPSLMRSHYLLSLALAALVLVGPTLAADDDLVDTIDMESYKVHRVQWKEVEGGYEKIVAQCGDHVEFVWDGKLHNVGIADKGDCAAISNSSEASTSGELHYVLDTALPEVAKDGKVYFACDVGSHCEKGQKIEVEVEGCEGNSATTLGAVGVASLLASVGVAALLAA